MAYTFRSTLADKTFQNLTNTDLTCFRRVILLPTPEQLGGTFCQLFSLFTDFLTQLLNGLSKYLRLVQRR